MSIENKIKEIVKFFNEIIFHEGPHEYYLNKKKLKSVSKTVSKFEEHTDFDKIAGYVAKSRGVSKAEILKEWKGAADQGIAIGNRVHDYAERYPVWKTKPTDGYEEAVAKFHNHIDTERYTIMALELMMGHPEFNLGGTCDLLLYDNVKNYFIIGDYKTNKDLFKNYKKKRLIKPFGKFLDNAFNKYQIQLSLYQLLFEQTGQVVGERWLIHVTKEGNYKLYKTKDLTERLLKVLENES